MIAPPEIQTENCTNLDAWTLYVQIQGRWVVARRGLEPHDAIRLAKQTSQRFQLRVQLRDASGNVVSTDET